MGSMLLRIGWLVGLAVLLGCCWSQARAEDTAYLAYPGDCTRFYQRKNVTCPTNSYWNDQLQRCEANGLNGCAASNSDKQRLPPLCAGQMGALLPYPGDCTRFVQCDYLPFVKSCPQFLYWNSKLLTCDKICV